MALCAIVGSGIIGIIVAASIHNRKIVVATKAPMNSVAADSPAMRSSDAEERETSERLKVARLINKMTANGLLRIDAGARKAWIEPMAWTGIDAEMKEVVTASLASYCSLDHPSITIYDKQSGRELARYESSKKVEPR